MRLITQESLKLRKRIDDALKGGFGIRVRNDGTLAGVVVLADCAIGDSPSGDPASGDEFAPPG